MANQYGRWFVRNDPQNWRKGMGAYNRPFSERYQRPPAYPPRPEAYKDYPAMLNVAAEQEKKKEELQQQNDASKRSNQAKQQSKTAKNAGRNVGNIVKNVAGKVVAVVGGGAVVVAGYEAIVAAQTPEPAPIVQYVEADWLTWNENEMTIPVKLYDEKDNVIKEITAVVSIDISPATCTEAGSKTYTATYEEEDKTYTDTHSDALEPIGHDFGEGKPIVTEKGAAIEYECAHCHEKFTIETTVEENE